MVLILSDEEIGALTDLQILPDVIETALRKQAAGEVERPERPHYDIGTGLESSQPLGTGLVMPAYIHGTDYFATKLVSLHEDNSDRGLPTLHAQLVLADAQTGEPVSFMDATRITNGRTGCIGGLAARELANSPVNLAVIGAGAQARWQTRAIATLTNLDSVTVYSPSESKHDCVSDLQDRGIPATAADTADAAVRNANVVVTATTSTTPVFSVDAIQPGTLVIGVGAYASDMQELEAGVFDRATNVFADVPEEVIDTGDLAATDLAETDLIPMAALFDDQAGRESEDDILVVDSVGSAVFDVAAASHLYETATEHEVGTRQSL
ncbi:ornithine cyclodeaminase family protein [Halomicrococcus sp. NG-SE-24]|uniref:ornithine cyclodeaminase family protein n=1 Tax=Halomicrococcus sp. NG-SE-24 TaxID=3436928 RepID=UPI003D99258A